MLGHTLSNYRPSIWVPGFGLVKPNARLYPVVRVIYLALGACERSIRSIIQPTRYAIPDVELQRIGVIVGLIVQHSLSESDFIDLVRNSKMGDMVDHSEEPENIEAVLNNCGVFLGDTSAFLPEAVAFCRAAETMAPELCFFEAGSDNLLFVVCPPGAKAKVLEVLNSSEALHKI